MPKTEIADARSLLSELETWVRLETPTTEPTRVNALMDIAAGELARAGAAITRIAGHDGYGDIVVARINDKPGVKPILVVAHLDTVWSTGTLQAMPFRVDGERAHGPGIFDMKAGSFGAVYAMRGLARQRLATKRPITLLLTPDEEVGSPTSRAIIEREAAGAAIALIPEPAGPGGVCVTARKGVGRFTMRIEGVGSHSGAAYGEGASAVVELAHQILQIEKFVDLSKGITLNVAPIWGGARPNVIAAEAGAEIDLRVMNAADGVRLVESLLSLKPADSRCRLHVGGGMNRPPYGESPAGLALYDKVRGMAAGLGLEIGKQHRGGGSDGNFTAALGVPTLDGLGCPGAGAHASHEHILWRQLEPRVALMATLMEELEQGARRNRRVDVGENESKLTLAGTSRLAIGREGVMYAAIRQVKAKPGKTDELAQRIKGAVPIISGVPGFMGYYVIYSPDDTVTAVSIFNTVEQAQESNRRALAWIEKHLGPFVIGPATATAGPVIVHSVP